MMLLAESAGRWLEPVSNGGPRGMIVHDRTRLTGLLTQFFVIHEVMDVILSSQ